MFGTEKKEVKAEAQAKVDYDIMVTAARTTKNDKIVMVDLNVNGVFVKSCILKELTVKKDGTVHKAGDIVYKLDFPAEKVGEKYFNMVRFPVSNDNLEKIIDQVKSLLK